MLPVKKNNNKLKLYKENTYEKDYNNLLNDYKQKIKTQRSTNFLLHDNKPTFDKKIKKEISTSLIGKKYSKNDFNNSNISNISYYAENGKLVCNDCNDKKDEPKNQYEINRLKNLETHNFRVYQNQILDKKEKNKKEMNSFLELREKLKSKKKTEEKIQNEKERKLWEPKKEVKKKDHSILKNELDKQIEIKKKLRNDEKENEKKFLKTTIELNGYHNKYIGDKNIFSKDLLNQINYNVEKKSKRLNNNIKTEREAIKKDKELFNIENKNKLNKKKDIKENLIGGMKDYLKTKEVKINEKKKVLENNKKELLHYKNKIENEKKKLLESKKLHNQKHINFIKSQIIDRKNWTNRSFRGEANLKKYSCIDCKRKYPPRYLNKTKY